MAAWYRALLATVLLDSICAVRESVTDLNGEVMRLRSGLVNDLRVRQRRVQRPEGEDEDEETQDEDEEAGGEEDGPEEGELLKAGKKHGEAKYIYKPATDGFRELDKVVESIDAAADDASSKAKQVDTDYAVYRGRMHDTGEMLDRLSLSGEQFKKEVVDYFANAETDRFSPLAVRVPYRDFTPDVDSVERLRVAEVRSFPCKEPAAFCCSFGMFWSDLRKRTSSGCEAVGSEGCTNGRIEHPAVSRTADTEDGTNESAMGECVPKDGARYFRKSSDWEDESKLEESELLSDLAFLPEAENVLAEKLSAANTPKHALVQSVCQRKQWVQILDSLGAKLCSALSSEVPKHQGKEAKKDDDGEDEDEDEEAENDKEKEGGKEDDEKKEDKEEEKKDEKEDKEEEKKVDEEEKKEDTKEEKKEDAKEEKKEDAKEEKKEDAKDEKKEDAKEEKKEDAKEEKKEDAKEEKKEEDKKENENKDEKKEEPKDEEEKKK